MCVCRFGQSGVGGLGSRSGPLDSETAGVHSSDVEELGLPSVGSWCLLSWFRGLGRGATGVWKARYRQDMRLGRFWLGIWRCASGIQPSDANPGLLHAVGRAVIAIAAAWAIEVGVLPCCTCSPVGCLRDDRCPDAPPCFASEDPAVDTPTQARTVNETAATCHTQAAQSDDAIWS